MTSPLISSPTSSPAGAPGSAPARSACAHGRPGRAGHPTGRPAQTAGCAGAAGGGRPDAAAWSDQDAPVPDPAAVPVVGPTTASTTATTTGSMTALTTVPTTASTHTPTTTGPTTASTTTPTTTGPTTASTTGPIPADTELTERSTVDRPPARPGTFAALRIRNYRLFFSGQMVSNTGTWMQRIAQDWLVLELTHSPLAVGITTALQFLPMLLFGLWGGLIADRYPKRRLLMITQASMGALAVLLTALVMSGTVQVWHVYLIAFGLGVATVVDNPTRQTFVNEMVPTDLVRNAVGLNSGNFQLGRMLGPAVAGVLIAAVGIGWAFAFNALSFAAVLAALLLMRPAELQRLPHATRARGQLREGLRYVRQNPILLWPIVLVFFIGTFGYNFAIILSAYTQNVFRSGADLYGLLNTAMAAGSVTGALFAARRTSARLPMLFLAAGGFALGLVVLGLTPWFWPFLVLLVLVGFVSVTFNTLGNATVQLSSSPELRGRVMSLYMLVFMGGTPLGSPIVGAITQAWGAPAALIVSGLICLLATAGSALLAARSTGVSLRAAVPGRMRRLVAHPRGV